MMEHMALNATWLDFHVIARRLQRQVKAGMQLPGRLQRTSTSALAARASRSQSAAGAWRVRGFVLRKP